MTDPTYYDALRVYEAFRHLCEHSPGLVAPLRRCASPDDVALLPVAYRLVPDLDEGWARFIFILPWLEHIEGGPTLGQRLANYGERGVGQARVFQMYRAKEPLDLHYLRLLCRQVEPAIDLRKLGPMLLSWPNRKREIVEDYLRNVSNKEKNE